MLQSRLITYLRELSNKERERFRQFVHSPYFNQHKKTMQLLDILLRELDKAEFKLSRESLFRKLFPGNGYEEQKLHNVMSYLKKLFHNFLAHQFIEDKPFTKQLNTLEAAFQNNQFDLLKNRAKQLDKSLERHPYRNSSHYFSQYRLYNILGNYIGQYVDRSDSTFFQKMVDSLDKYYITEKLKNCCHLTANMEMMNTRYQFHFLEELLQYIKDNWDDFQEDIPIVLYYTILLSLREEKNPEHYNRLKKMLALYSHLLSPGEGRDLYVFAYNYCIRQINLGYNEYQKELFQLYKQGLTTGLLLVNGLILEWDYKNITTLGCSLREFAWTEEFIQNYKEKLPAHQRENAYNYNLANLYYNKKKYSDALSALLLVEFTDVKYHLSTTFLLLRTYYALRDTEALLSLIEAFRIYIMRNKKMTTHQKRGYTNFLRFAKKLVLLKHQAYTFSKKALSEKIASLYQKIQSTENVINRQWLIQECKVHEKTIQYKPFETEAW